jgi:hypothetical protein
MEICALTEPFTSQGLFSLYEHEGAFTVTVHATAAVGPHLQFMRDPACVDGPVSICGSRNDQSKISKERCKHPTLDVPRAADRDWSVNVPAHVCSGIGRAGAAGHAEAGARRGLTAGAFSGKEALGGG